MVKSEGGQRESDGRFARGFRWVVEFDIRDFFGGIDHERLLGMVEARVSDRRVVTLVRLWLQAGVMEDGELRASVAGTPQGGVISPLLANIYLHAFDQAVVAAGVGELVRHADDGVLLCRTREQAEAASVPVERVLGGLGLRLHPDKTRIVDLDQGREGFDFLGWHFRAGMSGRLWEQKRIIHHCRHRWPSPRAMKAIRTKIKDRTGRNRVGVRDIRVLIAEINPILRGWGGYFRTGNSDRKFDQVDDYVRRRLRSVLIKKRGRNLHAGVVDQWTRDWFHQQGVYRLSGTIRHPKAA